MPVIPNYFARFRTQSQSTAASSPSTAPSNDPPTPITTPDEDSIVPSLRSKIMSDGDSAPPLSSRAAASVTRRQKSRSLTLNQYTPDAVLESGGEVQALDTGENGPTFISRMLSNYSSARNRSFTLPFTGVSSATNMQAHNQTPKTPVSSFSGSYQTPPTNGSSSQASPPSAPSSSSSSISVSGGHKRSSLSRVFHKSADTSTTTQHTLPNEESHKQKTKTSRQHDTPSLDAAVSRVISQSGQNTGDQGRPGMTQIQSPLVTTTTQQTEIFFTPPRTSTPPPPGRSPNSYRGGRQPTHTFPPRSRSRHTFDGGTRSTVLGQLHGSPVVFPSFRRMSESLSKIMASPSNSDKSLKEPVAEDDVFTDTRNNQSNGPKFVLSGERRLSADWSSIEAIRGNAGGAESWPSSVSKEMVRISLKEGSSNKSAGDIELGSSSSPDKSLASDIDINPKNPTLFGSIGEDRREFFRANILGKGRRGQKVRSSLSQLMTAVGGSGSATNRDNNNSTDPTRGDRVNVSESKVPTTSVRIKGPVTKGTPTLTPTTPGGSSIPYVSVTAATPVDSRPPFRLSVMSDPGPGLESGYVVGSKRKITDAEEEPVSSSVTASTSAPVLNGGAHNKNSVRSILLTRRESVDRPSDASQTSHAPSSFRQPQSKRIRLSDAPPPSQAQSRPTSPPRSSPPRNRNTSSSPTPSRPGSALRTGMGSAGPRAQSQTSFNSQAGNHHRSPSLSGSGSIPVLAILTPKPPSIDTRHSLNTYHMRDPSLPPSRRQSAIWKGAATIKVLDEDIAGMRSRGSLIGWGVERTLFPLQGWAFILGFVVFPLWWIAALCPVHWGWGRRWRNRRKGDDLMTEEELQDIEILECDVGHTWRKRCRIMSLFGLFVYVPIIVLIAVLVPRSA